MKEVNETCKLAFLRKQNNKLKIGNVAPKSSVVGHFLFSMCFSTGYTVRKFHDFHITQILREINFEDS